ncbi:MAG: hypothetical protein Q8K89_12450 [Actinomycetota bacterium]|nr:hypothetical protein [Actinomycetota bacterium]
MPTETAGDSDNDRMWLGALEREDDTSAALKFSLPYVYNAASWQDCGCGWVRDTTLLELPGSRRRSRELTRACVVQLRELVERLLAQGDTVELFFTWEGDQADPIRQRLSLRPNELGDDQLALEVGDFAAVSLAAPS